MCCLGKVNRKLADNKIPCEKIVPSEKLNLPKEKNYLQHILLLSFCPQFAAVLNTKKAKIRQLKELGLC